MTNIRRLWGSKVMADTWMVWYGRHLAYCADPPASVKALLLYEVLAPRVAPPDPFGATWRN